MNKTTPLKSKRVAIVLGARHNFWLDQRVLRTARALVSGGYEIITYTPRESKNNERPMQGVVPKYVSAPGSGTKLFRKLLLDYLLYNIPAALDMRRNKVQICHCNDFDTLPCGVLLKLITLGRAKIVYDSHEDYPLFVEEGYGKLFGKLIGFAEAIFTRLFVDRAITVNETIKAKFERMGITSEAIFNCQDLMEYDEIVKNITEVANKNDFLISYQGFIRKGWGYEQLIEAADILIHARDLSQMKFLIIGDSRPFPDYQRQIEKLVGEKGLAKHFVFTGFIPYGEMMKMLKNSDVGVMPFEITRENKEVLPNKFFENLAASIPTIASNVPEIAKIITEEKCGLLLNSTQPREIADAIEYLYRNKDIRLEMGHNALTAASEKYNFAKQAEKLLKVYEEIERRV